MDLVFRQFFVSTLRAGGGEQGKCFQWPKMSWCSSKKTLNLDSVPDLNSVCKYSYHSGLKSCPSSTMIASNFGCFSSLISKSFDGRRRCQKSLSLFFCASHQSGSLASTKRFAKLENVLPKSTNEHQNALMTFAHFLEQKMSHVEELAAVGYRSLKSLGGPLDQLTVARDRFLLFLHHGQAGRLD